MFPCEIRADSLPSVPAVHSLEKKIRRVIEDMRIDRRENYRLGAIGAVLGIGDGNGRDILYLTRFQRILRHLAPACAINNVGVKRVRRGVTVFDDADGMPVTIGNFAIVAAARNADRAAFLLPTANKIGKRVACRYVIKLGCRLVIPSAPRLPAVDADERALIANQQNNVWILRIDPHILVVVAAWSAAETHPRFSAIRGFHRYSAGAVDGVRIFWVNSRHRQIATADASRWPWIGGNVLPIFSRVIGAINPNFVSGGVCIARTGDAGVKPGCLAGSNC